MDQIHDVFFGRVRGQAALFQAGVEDHAESRQDRQEDQQYQPKPQRGKEMVHLFPSRRARESGITPARLWRR